MNANTQIFTHLQIYSSVFKYNF